MKNLIYLISPTLIYFSIQGSQGAKNLLTAWTIFGFVMCVFVSFIIGVLFLAEKGLKKQASTDEKLKGNLDKFYESLRGANKMKFTTWLSLGYLAVFAYFGWWVLFAIDALGLAIFKFSACFLPDEE